MKRIAFKAIPGCVGKLVSNIELVLSHPDIAKLKDILQAKNTSAAWKLRQADKSLIFYQNKMISLQHLAIDESSDLYTDTASKIDLLEAQTLELKDQLVEIFYLENDDGTLSVPAGFWWLCERIEGDRHLNKELPSYKLPGLRPYQIEGLDALYKYRRGTIELATGLGKSKMIISAALAGLKTKKRVMIIVPTEYLVGQMYKEIKLLHENTTAIGGDYKHPKLGWDIMVITMASAPKFIDMATMLILDEAHHSPAATWAELLSSATDATHVYNFTATAFRSDGLDLAIHSFGGPVVFSRDARWGLNNNWLSPVTIVQIRIHPRRPDGGKVYVSDETMATSAYKQLMAQENIIQLIKDKTLTALAKGRKEMLIFKTVKMAEYFKKAVSTELKFQVAHADKSKTKNPKYPLHQFSKGESNLLVACVNLVSEGIDIPDCNFLMVCTQHSGDITTLQLLGRALRKAPGKENAVVIDIAVKGYKQFEGAAAKRLAIYKYLCDNVIEVDL